MRYLLIAAFTLGTGTAAAQDTPHTDVSHAIIAPPDQITWAPAPSMLPEGAKLAVLEGDPSRTGPFTMRLLMPDRYRIPPHYHPIVEHVTVVKGTLRVGMGEKFDASKLSPLPTGTFAALEPGTRHFVEAEGETILQLHGVGPWGLTYVSPADDPRRGTP
ncbi:MAG TPA: cupin domain-containing protein [Gemmatimonadales bacterium]|nr:cupin domain-containing protein [Gemmatimonadales bacterium]